MIDSRRNPKPTGPAMKKPSSSGPRCAMERAIRAIVSRSTGSRRWKLNWPAMPHMFQRSEVRGRSQMSGRRNTEPAHSAADSEHGKLRHHSVKAARSIDLRSVESWRRFKPRMPVSSSIATQFQETFPQQESRYSSQKSPSQVCTLSDKRVFVDRFKNC